jgi:limonene-1,2-epoxide hydrolase
MTEQTSSTNSAVTSQDNAGIVEQSLKALEHQDFEAFERLLHVDIVYQNVGLPTVHGRARVAKMMRAMEGKAGFAVKFHRNVAEGDSVLNERTDAIIVGPIRLQFWVCGVFEVHDGLITLWRDYFDVFDMLKATVRGLLGAVVPALRPKF